jgi:pimeloyl-ACP methyl ester carboxylesterase
MRDDVLRALDALGLEQTDLLGHSLGGMVAHLCAQHRPGRVRRLVLEDIGAPLPREPSTPERPDGDLGFDWDMVLEARAQLDRPEPAWLDGLSRITARTLVIGGGPDSHVPQDRVAELARRVPDARLVTIAAGHLVHRAEPGPFTREVLAFLAG